MITHKLLKSWSPCADGYQRFCELFPDGTDLQTAMDGLVDDGHEDWALWLFCQSRNRKLFADIISRGYRNSGDQNSGDRNSGDWNSGDWNSGDWNSGDHNSGHHNSGYQNSGYRNSGHRNSGDWNSGYQNSGHQNSGDRNSGYRNSGDHNSGHRNSGHHNNGDQNSGYQNSGDQNSGDWNSGHRNSGDQNSGHQNSGDRNSGDWNSGDWNSGDHNSGHFNSQTPDTIMVFNRPCLRSLWDEAYKPDFLFFNMTYLVNESTMTDEGKAADPPSYVRGGQLRTKDYKQAWKDSWDSADPADRIRVKELPNFDADVFFEITGIRVDGK